MGKKYTKMILQGKQHKCIMGKMRDKIDDREVYMKGIDNSYLYEGYLLFKTEEL